MDMSVYLYKSNCRLNLSCLSAYVLDRAFLKTNKDFIN